MHKLKQWSTITKKNAIKLKSQHSSREKNGNTISQQLFFVFLFYPVKAIIYHHNVGLNQGLIKNMLHPLSLKSVVH